MKKWQCDVCYLIIDEEEFEHVWELLEELSIEEFADVIECMGLQYKWEDAVICENCFNYYQ